MLLFRISLTWRRHVWNVRWLLQNARHVVERKWSSVRGCSAGGILRWLLPVWMLDREISTDSAAATTVDPSHIVLYVPAPAFGNQLQQTNIYYCAPLGQVISMQHVNLDNTFYDWLETVMRDVCVSSTESTQHWLTEQEVVDKRLLSRVAMVRLSRLCRHCWHQCNFEGVRSCFESEVWSDQMRVRISTHTQTRRD